MEYKLVIFGGTTEGRLLHDFAIRTNIPALTCVATGYGAEQLHGGKVKAGRLDAREMADMIERINPALVLDATHPYAVEVSRNISAACSETEISYLRVLRAGKISGGFDSLGDVIKYLETTEGGVFVTLGAKEARELTALPCFDSRLWLRILPSAEGLAECLALGYPAKRIICMQGPFSKALNLTMFRETGAKTLVTKASGGTGGFDEKIEAAAELGMETLILSRPPEPDGVSLEEAMRRISAL